MKKREARKGKRKMRTPQDDMKEYLSDYQQYYWKDPEHCRALQREKYKRYPEKMKAWAKQWQKNNPEKWKTLNRFNSRIWYWKNVKGDIAKASQLERAKKAYLALVNSRMRREAEKE